MNNISPFSFLSILFLFIDSEMSTHLAETTTVDTNNIQLLVYSYLLHTNCGRTAQAFARTSGLATTSDQLYASSTPAYLKTIHPLDKPSSKQQPDVVSKKPISQKTVEEAVPAASQLLDHHIECLHIRDSITAHIKNGEPQVALDLLTTYFRNVLIPPPTTESVDGVKDDPLPLRREFNATLLRFRLDTQHYVELTVQGKPLEALQFGQRTIWRYSEIFELWWDNSLKYASINQNKNDLDNEEVVSRDELKRERQYIADHISNVAALVAYQDPKKSSLAYLLEQERRDELAAEVNEAILHSMQYPKEPALVTIVRQLATTSAYLVGYRSSSSHRNGSSSSSADDKQLREGLGSDQTRQLSQPWVLGTFMNSEQPSSSS